MKAPGKYGKLLLAGGLLIGAVLMYALRYLPAKADYEQERSDLQLQITAMQLQLAENRKSAPAEERLEEAKRALEESRTQLYSKFPVELKEEDQILYMLYLEEKLGGEVAFRFAEEVDREAAALFAEKFDEQVFRFGEEMPIVELSDGAQLQGVTLTFDFAATYKGFKNMVQELATDDVITSVRYAELEYDTESDQLAGQLIVTRYVMADGRVYQAPAVEQPAVGKENIYEK